VILIVGKVLTICGATSLENSEAKGEKSVTVQLFAIGPYKF